MSRQLPGSPSSGPRRTSSPDAPGRGVPFLDLRSQHELLKSQLDEAVQSVIDRCAFIGGAELAAFERELAESMERRFARGTSSCTAALAMTLRALGIGRGDEVIVPAMTAVPTAEAVVNAGARPVLVDVEDETMQIDPKSAERAAGPRTRALLVVHLYGLSARIDRLAELARDLSVELVEDCAQAQGARFDGRRLGTFGRAACLSFFPSKNLGGFGDGGAVVTDDEQIDGYVRRYSDHGRLDKYVHEQAGANERLDGLQAAVLRVKLRVLDDWNARRRQVADWYLEELAEVEELRLPRPIIASEPVFHLYVVRTPRRDALARHLGADGIGTGLHYPIPLNLQPAFAWMNEGEGTHPVAETLARQCLSLPMDPLMSRDAVARVADSVRRFFRQPGGPHD